MKYIVKTMHGKVGIFNGTHPNQAVRKMQQSFNIVEDDRLKVYDDKSCWEYRMKWVTNHPEVKLLMKYNINTEQTERTALLKRLDDVSIKSASQEFLPLE